MDIAATPKPIPLIDDAEFWQSVNDRALRIQRCADCSVWRYPSSPICADCSSLDSTWELVSGKAEILSWIVFHRTYLPAYPAPHKVIAVRLAEGPILISNLEGPEPKGSWIGQQVSLVYSEMPDGVILPRFELIQ